MKFHLRKLFFSFVLFSCIFVSNNLVQAEEIGEGKARWNHTSGNCLILSANADYLSGPYNSYFTQTTSGWTSSACPVAINRTTFSASNVDLQTPSQAFFNQNFGGLTAFTAETDTTGVTHLTDSSWTGAIFEITYSAIYFNPAGWPIQPASPIETEFVIAHELGHVMGLGHTSNPISLMQPTWNSKKYYLPSSYENSQLRLHYGY